MRWRSIRRTIRGRWTRTRFIAVVAVMASVLGGSALGCDRDTGDKADTASLPAATLWVARSGCKAVTRVGATGRVMARIDVGCELRAVAVGAGGVWFSTDAGSVIRLDPASNQVVATIPVGTRAGHLVIGAESVWVSELDAHQVVRIDPVSNSVTARIAVGSEQAPVVGLVASEDSIWAIEDFALALVKIDPVTNAVTGSASLCASGECRVGSAAAGAERVWVVDCCTGEVLEIDPGALAVTTNARLRRGVWEVTGAADGVWALHGDSGRLVRLTPGRTRPAQTIETDARGASYPVVGAGSVWFHDSAASAIVRVSDDGKSVTRPIELAEVRALAVSD